MQSLPQPQYTAFQGHRRVASGPLPEVVSGTKELVDLGGTVPVLIFEDSTSRIVDVDYRGSIEEVLARLPDQAAPEAAPAAGRGPGRPKLGVVAREVTLLPRHWQWLNTQPGGASVALRKLVEEARRTSPAADRARQSQETVYRFLSLMAGDFQGYEEVSRAFYRGDRERFGQLIRDWPVDVRDHLTRLAWSE